MDRLMLSNTQWKRLESLLSGKAGDVGATARDNRRFVEAVLWIGRTGTPWRDLPAELGDWHNTHVRFSRWAKKGVWDRVLSALSSAQDREEVFLDSTAVRAHLHAAGAQKNTARKLWDALAAASEARSTALPTRTATRLDSPSPGPTKRTSAKRKPYSARHQTPKPSLRTKAMTPIR